MWDNLDLLDILDIIKTYGLYYSFIRGNNLLIY